MRSVFKFLGRLPNDQVNLFLTGTVVSLNPSIALRTSGINQGERESKRQLILPNAAVGRNQGGELGASSGDGRLPVAKTPSHLLLKYLRAGVVGVP